MTVLVDYQIYDSIEKSIIKIDPYDSELINPSSLDVRLHSKGWSKIVATLNSEANKKYLQEVKEWEAKGGGSFQHAVYPRCFCYDCNGPQRPEAFIDPLNSETYTYETFDAEEYILKPNEYIIASILERIEVPDDVSVIVCGKSSLARLGLLVHVTAGWVDPGFTGNIVLELVNLGPQPLKLTAGMRIAQFIFEQHEGCAVPYNEKKLSKYIDQQPGQGSLYWKNVK